MVKHQRRSHQRGLHPNEVLDDCTSESDSGESPPTPTPSSMSWPAHGPMGTHPAVPHGQGMHRAASFADFGQQMGNYNMGQQISPRHCVSGQGHYQGPTNQEQQHGMHMLNRNSGVAQQFYVMDQNNPGIAQMRTGMQQQQQQQQQQPYQMPRQRERSGVEMPYSAGSMASMSSSPGSFSSASGQSPTIQEGMYTHQSQQATAGYAMPEGPPTDGQQHHMVQYTQPMPQAMNQQPAHAEPWYQLVPAVEVATIGQLPPFGSGVYELYGGHKMEFEDATMQLPSNRIETI